LLVVHIAASFSGPHIPLRPTALPSHASQTMTTSPTPRISAQPTPLLLPQNLSIKRHLLGDPVTGHQRWYRFTYYAVWQNQSEKTAGDSVMAMRCANSIQFEHAFPCYNRCKTIENSQQNKSYVTDAEIIVDRVSKLSRCKCPAEVPYEIGAGPSLFRSA